MIKKVIVTLTFLSINLLATLPLSPIHLGAYNFTDNSARLSFKDLSDNELGFRIYSNKELIATAPNGDGVGAYQYINLYNLNSCTTYTISVVAYNSSGESSSAIKSFKTTGCTSVTDTETNTTPIDPIPIPLSPKNIGAYNFTEQSARLSFIDLSDNEDGFKIYHNDIEIAKAGKKEGVNSYQYINLIGLDACRLYTIKLVAYNTAGESSPITKSFKTTGCNTIAPENKAPTVTAGPNRTLLLGESINLVAIASDSDGEISSYTWRRGAEVLSTTANLNYQATTQGVDRLTLTVEDNDGAIASDTIELFISEPTLEINNSIPSAVDITLFGAIPNDNIDDTEAISNALAVSGAITMPTGVYNVKNLVRFGTTIIDGNGSTFKSERSEDGTSTNILKLKTELDSDKISIKNLILDGNCPTQYPNVGENIHSLIQIYDSQNILLEGVVVKDYSSQYTLYTPGVNLPFYHQINLNHSLDTYHTISIVFSKEITIRDMEQSNIKIEGLLIYESDNILIENFKSLNSDHIWTALHVVASDNITMKNITIADGNTYSRGSSVNFFANHYFNISEVNTTNKHGFDISNEVVDVPTGRVLRDTSYGTFTNCRFEGYHPLQAYPTKKRHESISFFNTKFIPSRVEYGAYAVRFQKAGELLFDNCTIGSPSIMTSYPMILGDTQKLTITNSTFLNTNTIPSVETGSIYIYGGEFGDLNISNSSFSGIDYTPIIFREIFDISSTGRVNTLRYINNTITDESELKENKIYKIYSLRVDDIVIY